MATPLLGIKQHFGCDSTPSPCSLHAVGMKHNLVVDAPNSLIHYSSGGWQMISLAGDPFANSYQNGTAIKSKTVGPTATLAFNGSAIWVYGARRSNHGNSSVKHNR
ncbi:uncharacterized protein EI90DRAFT_2228955 [Cantharellus anzutake]|uniref:uncharacterized protein n=1 Tax=Cantharellus anzutake TaxID=1750568 RepID=UPI00190366EE|nr:uncharacterized protein EI90DRAFT_2228955 [Cantharellus anzutake]KAF8324773.1 hypothetical protein EI90DRAFT_2228955 [Cantharellus anzutake]